MIRDRVQQTSTTSGLGPLTLDGTAAGYLTFAGAGYVNNDPLQYVVLDGNNWELIEGLFQAAGPSLTRVRTIASSSGSPINFSGAAKQVWADLSSEMVGPMGGRLRHVVTTNVGNAYTATYKPGLAALVDGMEGSIRINAANTGATTLVLNALAAKNVRKFNGAPVADADWKAGQIVNWKYDATADIIIWTNAPDAAGVKIVSGTTYTILAEDIGRLLRFTNGSGCAVTQPQALATNAFASPFYYDVQAVGGAVTVTPTTSQIDGGASVVFAVGTGGRVLSDNTNYFVRRDAAASLPTPISVRQTVLSGPVDSNGLPSFGGSTGSTTVTASGTIVATAANGSLVTGDTDRVGSIVNPSWTGLSTNGTMYLWLDIAANGVMTPGSGTLPPAYQMGGTYSTVANQFTFNIQEMTGKVGNGSVANQTYRVYVGEVTVAGGVVTVITWYAVRGRYASAFVTPLLAVNSSAAFAHNLGIKHPILSKPTVMVECLTTEGGWAVGDQQYNPGARGTSAMEIPLGITSALSMQISTGNTAAGWELMPKGGGASINATAANWKYALRLDRGW